MILETKAKSIATALGDGTILANMPWEMIMEFMMTILAGGGCFPTANALVETKNMGPLRKAALGVLIRQEFDVRGMRQVAEIRNAIVAEIESSNDAELTQAWAEANDAVHPDLSVM